MKERERLIAQVNILQYAIREIRDMTRERRTIIRMPGRISLELFCNLTLKKAEEKITRKEAEV